MDYRVDDKGKVFTKHVTKQSQAIVARVGNSIIYGTIHLTPDNRLKDELNTDERFVAVTQAQIRAEGNDRVLYETNALIVNKDRIEWIFPVVPPDRGAES